MKTLFVLIGSVFFTVAQVCGCCGSKLYAQSVMHFISKEETKTVKLKITGMTCAGCSDHVSATLKALDGIIEQKVEYPGNIALIKYDPSKITVDKIIKAIEKVGFKAATVSDKSNEKQS